MLEKSKYGILYIQYTSNQKTKEIIELDNYFDQNNSIKKLTYDFLKNVIKKEYDLIDFKMQYLKNDIFYRLDKDFKMELDEFKNNDLVVLIKYKIEEIKIKSLKTGFSKKLSKLNETFTEKLSKLEKTIKERFLLLDFFFYSSKKVLSSEDKNFLQQFYSNGEYSKLINLIKKKQNKSINENPNLTEDDNFLKHNLPKIQRNLSSVILEENEDSLDFAILYSEPLVRKIVKENNNEIEIITYKPVDFRTECNSIVDILKNMNKGVHLYLNCLREDSFKETIKKNPKILHLICHGGFNQKNEFYLEFEGEDAVLLSYNKTELKRIIKDNPKIKNIQLLFIDSYFSEEISSIFLDSGVGCVVSIQRETKIADKISKDFSKHFYSGILSCQTIKDSFNSAIESIKSHYKNQKSSYHSCCCSHLHKEDCLWAKENHSHNDHTPKCKCKHSYMNLHDHCQWSTWFLIQYRYEKSPQYKLVENEKFICCCSLELPHDETLKFKLRYRNDDETLGDKKIFFNLKKNGTVKIDNFGNNIFFDLERIIGFNLYIYRIFQYLVIDKKKVILLKGKKGSGKTSLAKKFTNYSNKRKKFDFFKYIDFHKNGSFINFESKLENFLQSMKGYYKKKEKNSYKKILIILDNMDYLINNDIEKLNYHIKNYTEDYNLYLIIISDSYDNDSNNSLNNFYENRMSITIKPLSIETGAKIFLSICKNNFTGNYFNLSKNKYFGQIYDNVDFYPRNIIVLANVIEDDEKDLDDVLEEYKIRYCNNEIKKKKKKIQYG